MSLRTWALKIGELKPLTRAGLLVLAVRCAMRVEPWAPPGAAKLWREGLEDAATAAFVVPRLPSPSPLRRALADRGALASNRLAATDEPLGRCMNYATQTLACAIDATSLEMGAPLKKAIVTAAKLSASIPALLAHAGRVDVAEGEDAVEIACRAVWSAIRADIAVVAVAVSGVGQAGDKVRAIRGCAELWEGGPPRWASPGAPRA